MSNTNGSGVDFLLELNTEHSRMFCDPGVASERRRYRAEHPTEIAAFKCMDGRLHLPVMTQTALGIIQPWRNLGGRFDLGWPLLGETVRGWQEYAISRGRRAIALITYHLSRGDDRHRGCAGFDYNSDAAKKFTASLKKQFDEINGRGSVYGIHCGIETDLESLILHGENGQTVDLSEVSKTSEQSLTDMLRELYPDLPEVVIADLVPLVSGNIRHIAEIRASNRPVAEFKHREWILGIGRGFDWLHLPNTALLVGPFDPDIDIAIKKAAGIIKTNLNDGAIAGKQIVLMTSAPYRDPVGGYERNYAFAKATYLMSRAKNILRESYPELLGKMQTMTAAVDFNTRKLDVSEITR